MKLSKALQKFVEAAKADDTYWVERAKLDFSLALEKQRRRSGMNYAAIARKIQSSAAYITKVFRGESNLTIESMVKLARATGGRINIEVVDEQTDSQRWATAIVAISRDQAANHSNLRTVTVVSLSNYAKQEDRMAA